MTSAKSLPAAKTTSKRRRRVSLDSRKSLAGWLFVLPFAIGFLGIYLPVIFNSVRFSFNEMKIVSGGYELTPVGWANYSNALLVDTEYVEKLLKSLQTIAFQIPAIVIFSLFIAVILNQKMIGRAAFRAIFFIPVIMATGLIDEIAQNNAMDNTMNNGMIDTGSGSAASSASSASSSSSGEAGKDAASAAEEIVSAGEIQRLFENMAIGTSLVKYVVQMVNNIFDIVNRSGVQMLIFLAGLQSVSPAIYESCSIDGASTWETFWKITLPMVSPMILVNAVYTVIDSFTSEDNVVMAYIKQVYNNQTNGNVKSSAMSWIYFLIILLIVGLVALILRAFVFYQRKD